MGLNCRGLFPLEVAAMLKRHSEMRSHIFRNGFFASINAMIFCCPSLFLNGPFKSWALKKTFAKIPIVWIHTSILPRLVLPHDLSLVRAVRITGMLVRRFKVVREGNIWNSQTLEMSNSLHVDFLTEPLST